MNHSANRAITTIAVLLTCVATAGCLAKMPKKSMNPPTSYQFASREPADLAPYKLQIGDRMAIKFYRNPELDQEVIVRPDGKISLPFIDEMLVAGMTPAQLDLTLTEAYRGELTIPDITVIVQNFAGHRYYIDGQIASAGVKPLQGGTTLYQAIQESGGRREFAHNDLAILVRTAPDGSRHGYAVDLSGVRSGLSPEDDVPLEPFDIVHIPHSRIGNANVFIRQYIQGLFPLRITPFL